MARIRDTYAGEPCVRCADEGFTRCGPVVVSRAEPGSRADVGLVWWSDGEPAIGRLRAGRGFRYLDPEGRPVPASDVARIRRLAIPPAWRDVRICPRPDGYLQATGRDARGRKQYRYHPAWRRAREDAKFRHLLAFGRALPAIRGRAELDLRLAGMPRARVLALVVRLLDLTRARVGNERYARENGSFGLTTLNNRHAVVDGSTIRLRFRGKSGRMHQLGLRDRRLATLVRRCRELPGRQLFEYCDDDGIVRSVRSEDVNDYLREASGADVTAKMFRTWAATVLACRTLGSADPASLSERSGARAVRAAVELVARELGNTPAVARKSYIHPAVPEAFVLGRLPRTVEPPEGEGDATGSAWTDDDEAATLAVLCRWTAERPDRSRRAGRARRESTRSRRGAAGSRRAAPSPQGDSPIPASRLQAIAKAGARGRDGARATLAGHG